MDAALKAIAHTVTTPQWLLDLTDDYAINRGLNRSAVVTTALRAYLQFAAPEEYNRRLPPVATGARTPVEPS